MHLCILNTLIEPTQESHLARIKKAYQQAKRFWLEIVLNFTEIGMFPNVNNIKNK
jgi:hypothetical protein